MIKPKIDIEKTLGSDYVLIDAEAWSDFNDSSKILGTKLTCGAVEKFEKFTVKIAKQLKEINIKNGNHLAFENLQATLYVSGQYVRVSFKADDVKEIQEESIFK